MTPAERQAAWNHSATSSMNQVLAGLPHRPDWRVTLYLEDDSVRPGDGSSLIVSVRNDSGNESRVASFVALRRIQDALEIADRGTVGLRTRPVVSPDAVAVGQILDGRRQRRHNASAGRRRGWRRRRGRHGGWRRARRRRGR